MVSLTAETIKAFGFYRKGDITQSPPFEFVEIDRPVASGRDLLVEVRAVSVNPTDLRTRDAKKEDDHSLTIVGRDAAGVVLHTGEDCSLFEVGDEVFYAGTNNRPGSLSELHLVDERIVGRKPKNLDFPHSAALPLTGLTAMEALFDRLGVSELPHENKGKKILIIGAAGGVGSVATQIAKLAGLEVIGTASRTESSEWAKGHGADWIINHHQPFGPQLHELEIEEVDFIFCLTNVDDHMANMAEVIMPQGKICTILPAFKPLDLRLFSKSVSLSYELMYTRSVFGTEDMVRQHHLLNQLADWVESGLVKSTMTRHFQPINEKNLEEAYQQLLTSKTIGKIVLEGPLTKD
ncbi:MAG TPA: zinc-binding alcohol dehydrogenase family protein [Planococcus sp. (in: firmicutes)]|nr:zinc-binding alcohol dehydrogenase family protein [Planococcus sp. (in: firmicutes)]